MKEYSSSSEESSSSVSSAGGDNMDDEIPGHSQNSDSKCSQINPEMQQPILDHSSLYPCPHCCFQAVFEKAMKDHLVFHFTKSVYQCQHCSFSIGTVSELYLHTKYHHLSKDHNHFKADADAAALGISERKQEEPVESSSEQRKRLKLEGYEQREAEFKCTDCDYSTLRLNDMKRHRVGHEREEEFKCDSCNFSSSLKNQLSFHSSRFHRNPPAAPREVKKENHSEGPGKEDAFDG